MMMIEAPSRCADCVFYHTHDYYSYHDCGRDYHLPFEQRRKDNKVDPKTRPQWCIDKDVEVEDEK